MMPILTRKERLIYSIRNRINSLQFRLSPLVRNATRAAHSIFVQTSQDQIAFDHIHHRQTLLAHEQAAGTDSGSIHRFVRGQPLSIAWVGRCIDSKALPILLEAISDPILQSNVILHIIGDGPKQSVWQRHADRLGLASYCNWHGWLNHQETLARLEACDLLAFTSLREGTPATVLQALSFGVPIVCFQICGFGDIVDSTCGIPIAVTNPRQAVLDFRTAIYTIIDHPERIEQLSAGALNAARTYSWDHLADQIRLAWDSALGLSRPDSHPSEEIQSEITELQTIS